MKRLFCAARAPVLALALVGALVAASPALSQGAAKPVPASSAKLKVLTSEPKVVADFLAPDPAPTRGGTIGLRIPGSPQSFNYYGVIDNNAYTVLQTSLDMLVEPNPLTQEIEPALAKSWRIAGNEVTFSLRDVKWSDGVPFDADDVLFTFNYFVQNKNAKGNNVDMFQAGGRPFVWTKIDARTVKVTMAVPSGTLFRSLTFCRIYPRHILEGLIDPKDMGSVNKPWTTDSDPALLVGTGPYVIDRYIVDQKVVMRRNPYSWRVDKAGNLLPYADLLEYLIVKDNEVATLKFMSGEIDYVMVDAPQFPMLMEKSLAPGAPFAIYRTEPTQNVPSLHHIAFNWDDKNPDLKALFRNKDFRVAMEYALDRPKIIDQVWSGLAVLPGTPVLPSNKAFYDPKIEKIRRPFDAAKAAALLDKLDLKDRNGDGWRDFANGKTAEFVLTAATTKTDQDTAVVYSEGLKKLGLKCELQVLDPSLVGEKLNAGNFDAAVRAFGNQPDPHLRKGIWQPGNHLYYWHLSTIGADDKVDFAQLTPWEKEVWDIFEKGAVELDQAKRKALYDRYQEIFAEELPVIFVCKGMNLYGGQKSLGNYYKDRAGLIVYTNYTVYRK
jgi:peptide/nickel transport system substrate-binding protein